VREAAVGVGGGNDQAVGTDPDALSQAGCRQPVEVGGHVRQIGHDQRDPLAGCVLQDQSTEIETSSVAGRARAFRTGATEPHPDGHPQVRLGGGSHRADARDESEIDDEGEGRREDGEAGEGADGPGRRRQRPGPVHQQRRRRQDHCAEQHRASSWNGRREGAKRAPIQGRPGVADGGSQDRHVRQQLPPEVAQRCRSDHERHAHESEGHTQGAPRRKALFPGQSAGRDEVNTGETEFNIAATPALTNCSPQAIRVNGTTLFSRD